MADLKRFRQINGLSQIELAKYLEISGSFVSNIEAGRCALPEEQLKKILENDLDWDVSPLYSDSPKIINNLYKSSQGDHSPVFNDECNSTKSLRLENEQLKARIKELEDKCQKAEERVDDLITLMTQITAKKG